MYYGAGDKTVFLHNLRSFSFYKWAVLFQIIIIINGQEQIFLNFRKYIWVQQTPTWTLGDIPYCNRCWRTVWLTECFFILMINIHSEHPSTYCYILIAEHPETTISWNLTHYKQQKDFKRKQETKISICSLFNITTSFLSNNNINKNFHGQRNLNLQLGMHVVRSKNCRPTGKKEKEKKETNARRSISTAV